MYFIYLFVHLSQDLEKLVSFRELKLPLNILTTVTLQVPHHLSRPTKHRVASKNMSQWAHSISLIIGTPSTHLLKKPKIIKSDLMLASTRSGYMASMRLRVLHCLKQCTCHNLQCLQPYCLEVQTSYPACIYHLDKSKFSL